MISDTDSQASVVILMVSQNKNKKKHGHKINFSQLLNTTAMTQMDKNV